VNAVKVPQVHPVQRLTAPDGTEVDIDAEIVPLVQAVWALGLATTSSCQDFGDGVAGQRGDGHDPAEKHGDAFIAYYAGWSWLKMPVPDALRLLNLLLGTGFRDKITFRWEQDTWRLHIPVLYDEAAGIVPGSDVQIYFPCEQLGELTRTVAQLRDQEAALPRG
jgi:hypothetical protein